MMIRLTRNGLIKSILLILILALSVVATYLHTREKWTELGRMTGETNGKAQALSMLCQLATSGPIHEDPDGLLTVKASAVSLKRTGTLIEIRCEE